MSRRGISRLPTCPLPSWGLECADGEHCSSSTWIALRGGAGRFPRGSGASAVAIVRGEAIRREALARTLLALLHDPQEQVLERDGGMIDFVHLAAMAHDDLLDLPDGAFAQGGRQQLRFVVLLQQLVHFPQDLAFPRVENGDPVA